MTKHENTFTLEDVIDIASKLRQGLANTITPAEISPTAKIPFKLRVLRELILYRVSDLSDAACVHYNDCATIPALVLTRAAFETMAMLFYVKKHVEAALAKRDVDALDEIAMKGTFGSKDKSTPYESVNIITIISHLKKEYPTLEDTFKQLCEFSHPNCAGLMVAYEGIEEKNLNNPHMPLALGSETVNLNPNYGIQSLYISIFMADWFARELAKSDTELVTLCEEKK